MEPHPLLGTLADLGLQAPLPFVGQDLDVSLSVRRARAGEVRVENELEARSDANEQRDDHRLAGASHWIHAAICVVVAPLLWSGILWTDRFSEHEGDGFVLRSLKNLAGWAIGLSLRMPTPILLSALLMVAIIRSSRRPFAAKSFATVSRSFEKAWRTKASSRCFSSLAAYGFF